MTKFDTQVEKVLRGAGWYPGRHVPDLVASWKASLLLSDGFQMFQSAEDALLEFGGLRIDQRGPGRTCAREPFTVDPSLASYEGDRFNELSHKANTRLYPLGEASAGHLFLAIGENNRTYLLMNDIRVVGESIEEALQRLVIGIEPNEPI